VPLGDVGDRIERIDRAGPDRSRRAGDAERLVPGAAVLLDHRLERIDAHAKRPVDRHLAHVVAPDAEDRRGLCDRMMRLGRDVESHRARQRVRTLPGHVDRGLDAAGRRERREVRHRAAAHEEPVTLRVRADDLPDPFHGETLDLDRPWRRAPRGEVGVQRRSQQVRKARDRDAGRLHVPEHPRMSVVSRQWHQPLFVLVERRGEARPLLGQLAVERGADIARRRGGRDLPAAQALVVAHHQVDRGSRPSAATRRAKAPMAQRTAAGVGDDKAPPRNGAQYDATDRARSCARAARAARRQMFGGRRSSIPR
jgi:hypothetical protein